MSTKIEPISLPEVIEDIRVNPQHGLLTLAASGEILEGVSVRAEARQHQLALDEPMMLGGTDTGPNPVEAVLAALGACQAITYRVWAAMLGVQLDGIRFETEGDIDLNGFFGLNDTVRPGLQRIRHRVVLIGPESEERYHELAATVDRHCPVLDIVANGLPVERVLDVRAE